jgi:alkylated DNA repair dioxygenase AlkB
MNGLTYIPNFLEKNEIDLLINDINNEKWLTDLKRRVQHYGYKYNYKLRSVDKSMYIGDLPNWSLDVVSKFDKYINFIPDQLIINEYEPGQGIASHIDCQPCFGDTILSVSLGHCLMDFMNIRSKKKKSLFLETGSLLILSGESRYEWTHGIVARKSDIVNFIHNFYFKLK